jgi:hypothetical protein
MNKKTQRTLAIVAIALVILYLFKDRLMGLTGKTVGNSTGGGLFGGGGFGGGSNGGGSTGLNVGPYTYQGATAAEGYATIGYKPQAGEGITALPSYCISDAFTLNGINYCVSLDSRGNEVTRRIS